LGWSADVKIGALGTTRPTFDPSSFAKALGVAEAMADWSEDTLSFKARLRPSGFGAAFIGFR
jgi:hypothetical protein